MPQYVICKGCGYLLYKGVELKPADEIIQYNGGQCPRCGRRLVFDIENVEIRPLQTT